jgi:hypothetical protein
MDQTVIAADPAIPVKLLELKNKNPHCEFLSKLIDNYSIFTEIYKSCNNRFEMGCGSYLFDGQSYTYCDLMYEKQKLLYNYAKSASNILEIGVYMGHSLLIILLANPKANITCIDIDDQFSVPAIKVLELHFNTKIKFIKNNSLNVLPELNETFDLFHLDGCHTGQQITKEFDLCINKIDSKNKNCTFIFDDYDVYKEEIYEIIKKSNINSYIIKNMIVPTCAWRNILLEIIKV